MQRIIGSLLAVALWLTVWLSPLLPALWLTERVRRRHGVLNFYAMLMNNRELNRPGS